MDGRVLVTERCTIDRWRGYRSSTFFVSLDGENAFLESKPFPWRKNDPPPNEGRAREAFDELAAALEELGWAREGTNGTWYEARFSRLVERTEPADPEPSAEPEPEPYLEPAAAAEPPLRPEPEPEPEPQWVEPVPAPAPTAPAVAFDETGLWMDPPLPAPEPAAPRARRPTLAVVPPPQEQPRRRRRRPRGIVLVGATGAFIAAGSLALGAAGLGSKHSRTILVPVADAAPSAPEAPKQRAVAATTPAPTAPAQATVKLRIAATKSSWLELRRGSAGGRVLYAGQLDPGRVLHLHAPRIWARFGSAGNLRIVANGRRLALMGTFEHVFTARGR